MKQHIYTIPVNEAFDDKHGCPICYMHDTLEKNEIDRITGAAMMEPDVRIETNKAGFCAHHLEMMFKQGAALPLALVLESHINEISKNLIPEKPGFFSKKQSAYQKQIDYITNQNKSCYVCNRLDEYFKEGIDTFFRLYKKEEEFREKVKAQSYFCLPHVQTLIDFAPKYLQKDELESFYDTLLNIDREYLKELSGDINWFCKKFDYRFKDDDWKNSKDSVQRTILLLTSRKVEK